MQHFLDIVPVAKEPYTYSLSEVTLLWYTSNMSYLVVQE